ncbi:enediyne antibiotic chromoprotein [Streptomyces sp. NBC_01433]|uniref:enediyne antibiotic chromoprotein n=1 Tax=Streptomyces sp. NBC_01433 TaxID=2903864 RepID=UPI002251EB0F|nr:enediyne antibiotic chromoprotein [Streptomyces sp. NBC_01433]MCX4681843.1 enediyne antibiotic chromoprotein [Streptomyces sp. NBC_01433]
MTATNKLGLIARIGATAAVAAGLALAVQPSAMAAAAVTVSQSTGLSDGQQISVTATGLTPNTQFQVGQCAVVEPGKFGCDKTTSVNVTADATGKITSPITVHTSFQAVVGADGTVWGNVDAKATQTQIVVLSATGDGGSQAINFK